MFASQIADRAARIALDEGNVRWTLAEMCLWISDGQREVALLRPSAISANVVLPLVQGTRQELPAAYIQLLRVVRNVTLQGGQRVPGRTVRVIGREVLDAQMPDWHMPRAAPYSAIVKHFIFDEESPRGFYVYPGNTGAGAVEAIVSRLPAELVAPADASDETLRGLMAAFKLDLDDTYLNPLVDYVSYRMHSKDAQSQAGMARAAAHYQQFAGLLGLKAQSDLANSPNPKGAGVAAR